MHIVVAVAVFRTVILHYAFLIWCVIYLLERWFENHKRKVRYIVQVEKTSERQMKNYKYFYTVDNNKKFSNLLKEAILLRRNKKLDFMNIKNDDKEWEKSFLPFDYFVMGLIVPSVNLLINGTQYFIYDNLLLDLFKVNILIFTTLWFLYPLAYYFSVKIETGKMFQCKGYFNVSYLLFSFAIFMVLNGIIINMHN